MTGLVWERTPERGVLVATRGGVVLTVSRGEGGWRGLVEAQGRWARSEVPFRRRLAAQAWCLRQAGGAR